MNFGIRETQRPDWLANRMRTMSIDENGPRFYVIRQPKGPDGTRGFKQSQRATCAPVNGVNGVNGSKSSTQAEIPSSA